MQYANLHGYSDIHPYEVVRMVSDKTVELRSMTVHPDPNWKPVFYPGGFAAHCANSRDQSWIIKSNPSSIIIRARKRKDGKWYSAFGRHVFSDKPRHYYDYNF